MANDVVISDQRLNRAVSYAQARILLLCAGLLFLGITAGVNYVRRVETAEVVAILLFMPIFVAFVFWDWIGGAAAAGIAIVLYVALRADAIHAVGLGEFAGVILSRSVAFLAFGLVGGLANKHIRGSLTKLDLYDHVDDVTGLYNARFFIETTNLEMSRASRYDSIFSVSAVDIPATTFAGVPRRRRTRVLREIATGLRRSVRTVDRVSHASDGTHYRFAIVLPETGAEGARVFTDRLVERLSALLGVDQITGEAITFPGDNGALDRLRSAFIKIDREQHPEHPALEVVAA